MFSQYKTALLIETGVILVVWTIICLLIFGGSNTKEIEGIKVKKKSVFSSMSKSQIITMVLAVVATTYLLSSIHEKTYTTVILFITISAVAPYVVINNMHRIEAEKLFNEIVVTCQSIALLLRQTGAPYEALVSAANNITNQDLRNDVNSIAQSLYKPKEVALELMDVLEKKYPYTVIKSLNIIIIYMFYESSKFQSELLELYEDDVHELQKAIKKNQTKRTTLRIQYIGINVGCLLTYSFFLSSIKGSLGSGLDTGWFSVMNTSFLTLMVISLYLLDSMFCKRLTTE